MEHEPHIHEPHQYRLRALFKAVFWVALVLGFQRWLEITNAQLVGWTMVASVFGFVYFSLSTAITRNCRKDAKPWYTDWHGGGSSIGMPPS